MIGLSGGIDSSLVAAVAVDALGPAHVHGVTMPSRYSSEGSVGDAVALADNLGMAIATVTPTVIASDGTSLEGLPGSGGALGLTQSGSAGAIAGPAGPGGGEEDETMTMNNIQGQLRASSIRKVTQLVDRHPDTTLGIIRAWLATDH